MKHDNVDLAALIGSRICHDLISPIGAITNGLELLDMAGSFTARPELSLIADSVENANARVRFFRIAYGAAGDQILGRAETVSVLDGISRGGRLGCLWGPLEPQTRAEVRLAFLALQCCETALPYGGEVRITAEDGAWEIFGAAEKTNINDGLWSSLNKPDCASQIPDITAALVQFALLPALADDIGRRVQAVWSETRVSIRF